MTRYGYPMTMKQVRIAELKARLSEYVHILRRGRSDMRECSGGSSGVQSSPGVCDADRKFRAAMATAFLFLSGWMTYKSYRGTISPSA